MKRSSFFLINFILISLHGFSQDFHPVKNPQILIESFKKVSSGTQTIQAEFREEKRMAALKEAQHTSGIFFYKRQDKMRWEQKSPSSYVILISGESMKIFDKGKEKKVAGGGMAGQIKGLLIGLVNGDFQDDKAFSKSYMESATEYRITLTPVNRRLKNIYSTLDLTFNRTSLRLKRISFSEKGGDKSEMEFFGEKINAPMADSVFEKL